MRLISLLVVAVVAGTVAGTVARARASTKRGVAAVAMRSVAYACPIPAAYVHAFRAAARKARLPLPLLVAVARVESNLRSSARSSAGAEGLLQLLPSTAASLRLDPYRPESNVLAGARYLRAQLDRFRSADLMLAAYNAGPTAVARAGGAPSATTIAYVANVTRAWRELAACR
jgi:soluble lytic murein transglycosylase-like protein